MGYADDRIVAINHRNKGVRILKKVVFNTRNIYDVKKNMHQSHKICGHVLTLLKS
jgi:hypothetical protein